MMSLCSRYIARQLVTATALTALSLTSIVWLTQALRLVDYIVNQGIPVSLFLWFTALVLPSLLLMVLPLSLFAAAMFVYHKLKQESELVVMEVTGMSRIHLIKPALIVAAGVALFGYLTAFYFAPLAHGQFRNLQNYLRSGYVSVLLQDGVFNSPIDGLTVFVRERDANGTLKGILVHDNREPEMSVTMMAEEGRVVSGPDGAQRMQLTNGNRQEMREGKLSVLNFESYGLDLSFYAEGAGARAPDPRELYLPSLLATQELPPAEIARRRAELHMRLQWPAYSFSFVLLGLGIMLSGEFNRRGNGGRILLAVLAVALVAFTAVALRNVAAESGFYIALAYLNLTVPGIVGAGLLGILPARKSWNLQAAR